VFPELTTVRGHVVYERRDSGETFGGPVGANVRWLPDQSPSASNR
jgi:hypothetical protein